MRTQIPGWMHRNEKNKKQDNNTSYIALECNFSSRKIKWIPKNQYM